MRFINMSVEKWLYIVAFLIGLGMRIVHLPAVPLSEGEAQLALQPLALAAQQGEPLLSGHAAYILLTTVLFYITEATNFTARLIPVIFGSALVFSPMLFRKKTGQTVAIFLAFGLALDPNLIAVSRLADSRIMALSALVFAAGFYFNQKQALAGFCLGLALLSGSTTWMWLLILVLAYLLFKLDGKLTQPRNDIEGESINDFSALMPLNWKEIGFGFGVSMLTVGTLFFLVPRGVSGIGMGLVDFINGWRFTSGVFLQQLLMAVVTYELLIVLLGLWAGGTTFVKVGNRVNRFFVYWAFVGLLMVAIYPARQVVDLMWFLVPLWILAAYQLSQLLIIFKEREEVFPLVIQAVITIVLAVFIIFTMKNILVSNPQTNQLMQWRYVGVGAALLMILLVEVLISLGWSTRAAAYGLAWGGIAVLGVSLLAMGWRSTGLGPKYEHSLWQASPVFNDGELLLASVENYSEWGTGINTVLDVAVVGFNNKASLQWLLKDFRETHFSDMISESENPSMVITKKQNSIAYAATYSGQDFKLSEAPRWRLLTVYEWVRWMVTQDVPTEEETIVLWVRSDLFPGTDVVMEE